MIGIYKILNKVNGKFYIGQSNDIERRWKEHCSPSRYKISNIPLEWAIHKYGKDSFSLEVLQECSLEQLNDLETYWIKKTEAVQKGYNCNTGGNTGVQGEQNPNSKLSESDVYFIRKCYNERIITQKEAYEVVKDKVSFGTFQAVWQGKSWPNIMPEVYTDKNKEYYSKKAGIKVMSRLSDEQIMSLRKKYADGFTAKQLYCDYADKMSYQSFQRMLCGKASSHLPYFHKKTRKWILPGETPEKNQNRVMANTGRSTTNCYTDEEVLAFRKQYITQDYKTIYEKSDKKISLESFQKMLSGRTYTNLPIYSKTQKKWIHK